MTAPQHGIQPEPGDLLGRMREAEIEIRHLREADARAESEIQRLRDFRHAANNIVNGWKEFEAAVDAMQRSVSALQEQVTQLKAFDEKLTGPGGALEQLNSLAEDRRFKRRMLGWAAWLSGAVATAWAFGQALMPYIRVPPK